MMNRVMLLLAMVMGLVVGMSSSAAYGGVVMLNDGSFSYQGYMEFEGEPANGDFYFRFSMFDSAVGGSEVSPLLSLVGPITASDGLFVCNVQMGDTQADALGFWREFGDVVKYLNIEVGQIEGVYTTLGARVFIGSTPQALHSQFAQALTFPYTDSYTDIELDPTTMMSLTSVAGGTVLEAIAGSNESPAIIAVNSATPDGFDFGFQTGGVHIDTQGRAIGLLSIADQYAIAGLIRTESGGQQAAVLAQIDTGVVDTDALQALNFNSGTQARLATEEFAGDFNGNVIVRNQLRVRGVAERDYAVNSPSPIGPLAYATVSSIGTVLSGTANVSAIWNAAFSQYEVTVAGEPISFSTHQVTISVVEIGEPRLATYNTSSGNVLVKIWDLNSGNVAIQDNFSIVIYDSNSETLNRISVSDAVDEDKYIERTGEVLIQTRPRHEPVELKEAAGLQAQE